MTLSRDDQRAFLDLSQRHGDLVRALRRSYTVWQARQYAAVGGFLLGTILLVSGLLSWWVLSMLGLSITCVSCLVSILQVRRRQSRMRPELPSPPRPQAWKGLMG